MGVSTETSSRPADDRIRAVGPPFRLVLAVVLVAATPLVRDTTPTAMLQFGLFVAFCWIPVVAVLGALARRHQTQAVDLASLVVDFVLLLALQITLAPNALVVIVILLIVVAYYTYLGGRGLGLLAAFAGMALVVAVAVNSPDQVDRFDVAVYPFLVISLAWLLDAAATERRRERARTLRLHEKSDALLTGVTEAVAVTSPRGRIAQWNHAAEETFTCSADRARGRSCQDVLDLHVDMRELDCSGGCALLAMAASGEEHGDVEVWRTAATGQRQPLLASAVPVVDGSGTVVEIVHSFRDITKLKQADEAKTMFLATASHELKTPLTVIRGFSQMLLLPDAKMTDAERTAALRAIDARAAQLTAIVDRLLLSSRIEAGRVDLILDSVDLSAVLVERTSTLRAATSRDIRFEGDDDLPPCVADDRAITTVIDHLLDNAVKYSPGGGPICVAARTDDEYVEFTVHDDGVGMTAEQASRCFDRFWQAELTDVRRFGGTGIGLYIVKSLVEGMGGAIGVDTAPGEGATFTVALLRADVADERDGSEDATVDPGRGDRSIIREYMRQLGVHVESTP